MKLTIVGFPAHVNIASRTSYHLCGAVFTARALIAWHSELMLSTPVSLSVCAEYRITLCVSVLRHPIQSNPIQSNKRAQVFLFARIFYNITYMLPCTVRYSKCKKSRLFAFFDLWHILAHTLEVDSLHSFSSAILRTDLCSG